MPIKDRSLYPSDWKALSQRVREEAGQKCEQCGKPNGEAVYVLPGGLWSPATLSDSPWYGRDGKVVSHDDPRTDQEPRLITCVLTVAHLDHDPTNCERSNLRAWCQSCHLWHDRHQHAANAAETRRRKRDAGQEMLGLEESHV